jgi:hypothetical protein
MTSSVQPATYSRAISRERIEANAMWERMLGHIPTQLGKLVSVASFRVGASGEYRHPNLDRILSPEVARRVLCESHEQLFAEWVGLFPEEQAEDLKRYLGALPREGARELLLKASESLIPPSAGQAARRAFLCDLEAILANGGAEAREGRNGLQSVA